MPPLVPLAAIAPAQVEALLDRAFGIERRQRTAYRVRAGLAPIPTLSVAAVQPDGVLAGAVQCWPVALACDSGVSVPMVMVGPIAVAPECQSAGLGQAMTRAVLAMADASPLPGADAQMLVGDPGYYARFFGFSAENTARWRLPGPFDPARLLARGAVPDEAGLIVGRTAVAA